MKITKKEIKKMVRECINETFRHLETNSVEDTKNETQDDIELVIRQKYYSECEEKLEYLKSNENGDFWLKNFEEKRWRTFITPLRKFAELCGYKIGFRLLKRNEPLIRCSGAEFIFSVKDLIHSEFGFKMYGSFELGFDENYHEGDWGDDSQKTYYSFGSCFLDIFRYISRDGLWNGKNR